METVKIVYCRKEDEAEWEEQILTTSEETPEEDFEKAIAWGKTQGYVHFRVSTINLSTPPNFAETVNPLPSSPEEIDLIAKILDVGQK